MGTPPLRHFRRPAGRTGPGPAGRAPVPLENRICLLAYGFVVESGGPAVFVDQPVQHGFSADPPGIEVYCCDAGNLAVTAGNPLDDALMRPGAVVVNLVLDQDGPQATAQISRTIEYSSGTGQTTVFE
jgi:hypothetical protein